MVMITEHHIKLQYYQAILKKDAAYKDAFITAVKTTGIFCICTCYARKPKFENVEFYYDVAAAQEAGYRACKLCKPLQLN